MTLTTEQKLAIENYQLKFTLLQKETQSLQKEYEQFINAILPEDKEMEDIKNLDYLNGKIEFKEE